jgi:FkbM family methyltransferase
MNLERIGEIAFVPELIGDRPRLLEVGALSSDDAAVFLDRYPRGAAAICEPDPENFAALRPMPRLSLLNVAVGDAAVTVPFYHIAGHPDAGSLWKPPQHEPGKRSLIEVQMCDPHRVLLVQLGWARAEILALDCEGAESAILPLPIVRPSVFQQISVEFHAAHGYYTEDVRQAMTDDLCAKGYDLVPGLAGNYALFIDRAAKVTP